LPNVGPYIYDVSISGFTRSSIYIYDISSLRVKTMSFLLRHYTKVYYMGTARRFRGDLLSIDS